MRSGRAHQLWNIYGSTARSATSWIIPPFSGFAPLLLPWDDRHYDTHMSLGAIGSLLPYHSHVDPEVSVASLNRMIDDADSGRRVFYDFYTAAEKKAEPSRRNTKAGGDRRLSGGVGEIVHAQCHTREVAEHALGRALATQ